MPASARLATIAARTALPLVHEWRRRGGDPTPLLSRIALDEALLKRLDARIPLERFLELHAACTAESGDPGFALSALERLDRSAFPFLLHLASTQATILSGIAFARPFVGSLIDDLEFDFELEGDLARAQFRRAGKPLGPPVVAEYVAAMLWRFVLEVAPHAARPTLVELPHRAPRHGRTLADFFGCETRYGAGRLAMEGPVPSVPIPTADPEIGRVLAASVARWAPRGAEIRVRDRARHYLASNLAGDEPVAERLAAALRMSERSLRRRLKEEGTGLRELIADVRRERAFELLEGDSPNLDAIALELGYESATSFGRVFRAWTGSTPTDFVRARRAGR